MGVQAIYQFLKGKLFNIVVYGFCTPSFFKLF